MKAYRLRIKRLDFISAVDAGAQGKISNVALIKRAPKGGREVTATCKVIKLDEKLGLVFGWAMAGTLDGGKTPHVDLQDDAIDVSGNDFIKACAEFMEAGAASDVMHDGSVDGRIVFAMPLVKDVNTALGIKSDVEGLAIAMKPSPETFKRFLSGELAAFSIGGTGERAPLTKMRKQAVLTSVEDGHQHSIDLDDPVDCWAADHLMTSYQTSEGATESHSHAWVFDPQTGAVTIAMDSGHTHTVDAAVPAEVLTAAAAIDAAEATELAEVAANPSSVPCEVADEESGGNTTITVIAARAASGKSSPSTQRPTVKAQQEPTMPDAKDTQIAELEKRNARLEKLSKLNDAQRAHHASLPSDEADAFLAKSNAERTAVLAEIEKANEVVYTSVSTGKVFRKSDEASGLVEMAKQLDAQASLLAKATTDAETARLEKRAESELGGIAKSTAVRAAIIKAIDGIKDEAVRKDALEALKGADAAMKLLAKANGTSSGAPETGDAIAKFTAKRDEFAKTKSLEPRAATGAFITTPEGAALYAEAYPRTQN